MTTIAIAHNHEGGLQITTLSVYAVGASSAFFVLLAHDRPFVGLSARKRFGHARSEFEFLASRQLEAKSAPAQARAPPFVNRWSLTQRLRFSGSKARQRSWRFPLLWLLVLVPAWP
jgi:hypothetical protein